MIITTTQFTEGQTIREYKGIVVGEAIMGTNIARGLAKGMVGRTGMLGQNKTELRALSSSELDQLADFAPDELRNHLRAFEG
ncbi:MAG: hypothetical protein EBZ27_08355 [Rhodobacteraceae bacterium]|jgi:uncharacterized protein YbjQ (UPF0145 family)|nr:hypothetical protein [Paracoccaceae bacterium]